MKLQIRFFLWNLAEGLDINQETRCYTLAQDADKGVDPGLFLLPLSLTLEEHRILFEHFHLFPGNNSYMFMK